MFCSTLSTIAYSTAFDDVLIKYCIPKSSNDCLSTSEKATYTTDGCSCPVGRYFNTTDRKCTLCEYGSYKSNKGVGNCTKIVCGVGTYLTTVSACGMGKYQLLLQDAK
ncbi:MAG: hypothetical protein ACI4N3_04330 [Alphaproteobacteria bacterium]